MSRVPSGAAFAERIGAKAGLRMRNSQLDLLAIDRALIERGRPSSRPATAWSSSTARRPTTCWITSSR